jgi:hypothetical protein
VADGEDDGFAYMPEPGGTLVLADLTPDGTLTPITLIGGRFRTLTPGYCSVYGCTSPARHMIDGWPVCQQCRQDLANP